MLNHLRLDCSLRRHLASCMRLRYSAPIARMLFLAAVIAVGAATLPLRAQQPPRDPFTVLGRIAPDQGIERGDELHGIAAVGRHLFAASRTARLVVYDVGDPARPVELASIDTSCFPCNHAYNPITLAGSLAYVAGQVSQQGGGPANIIDVSDPAEPRPIAAMAGDLSGSVQAIAVSGSRAYLAAVPPGLRVYDVSAPSSPELLGEDYFVGTDELRDGLAIAGSLLYGWKEWGIGVVVDVADPSAMRLTRRFSVVESGDPGRCSFPSIAIQSGQAYLTCDDGLSVVDFTREPYEVIEGVQYYLPVGHFATEHPASHVMLDHGLLLLTDLRYLHLLDARDPEHVVELARWEHTREADLESSDWQPYAMSAVAGGRVYVASNVSGIHILDIDIPRPYAAARIALPWLGRVAR